MAYKVDFSEQAADDLSGIIIYITEELCNPQAAVQFYTAVDEKRGLLREYPYIFPLYHDEKLGAEGIRSVVVGNFLMFYVVDDEKSVVSIVRILYGRRDIPSVFEEKGENLNELYRHKRRRF